ncbi:MAG TPA: tubulin-like doman-containing protein [Gemmataceae bacterium]|jgi:serine/threonine protein kinase|nr:tubulin-like doman-containing protein [Gemmataceae bacterium]
MDQRILADAEPIPGYRLIERLGRGGYGEVWKAEAPGGMHKAIKFVAGDVDGFGEDGKAAEQEFKSLNRVKTIRHPFLLSIERFEVIDSQLVIVTELADRNLWDRFTECQKHGLPGIPRSELLRYMEEAAEALDLMNIHHQIQHLDVKPHNIFLVHQHVKVADFGLAKDLEGTKTDLTGGITPTYAPPETFEGWVSRQSDQYSLAIVFMEMLTGRRPFAGTNTRQLVMQHLTAVPDLSPLSPNDRAPIGRALAKQPGERFATCADLVRALRGEDRPAKPAGPSEVEAHVPRQKNAADTDVPGGPTQLAPPNERKSYPALVTPSSRHSISTSRSQLRRDTSATGSGSKPHVAPTERVGSGVLVPAFIVGLGGVGLAFMQALRQLVADRFGKPTLPHLRWLYVDTDPASTEAVREGPSGSLLAFDDVLIAPLHRPTHYLTAENIPAIDSWMPREELFRMPRTPATSGIRSLGRLSLFDHYHVICHRIRTALESFVSANPMDEADRLCQLGLRSNFPRIYLATSLTGGTGSGMYLDLAYLIRRAIRRLGLGKPQIVALLGVPTVGADIGDSEGRANARAALVELNHFHSMNSGYRTQFDVREADLEDNERPFQKAIFLPIGVRNSQEAKAHAADVAAHVAFADLFTPIGRAMLPQNDQAVEGQSILVGIRRVAWPRAAVLKTAAWELARKTLQSWCEKAASEPSTAAVTVVDGFWADRRFDASTIQAILDRDVERKLGKAPESLIDAALQALAEPSEAGITGFQRACKALGSLMEIIGRPGAQESENPNEVGRYLGAAVRELAAHGDSKLSTVIVSLVEQPGLRIAGAEDAVRLLRNRVADELAWADRAATVAEEHALAEFMPLHQQLLAAQVERGSKSMRATADYPTQLRQWATKRLQALRARACASLYRVWLGNLPEYLRDLASIRNRFEGLVAQLDSDRPVFNVDRGVCRAIFPDGASCVNEAASKIVRGLAAEDIRSFENEVQAKIRHQFRGLSAVCSRSRDTGSAFLTLLLEQATLFIDSRTPKLTASQMLTSQAADPEAIRGQIAELLATSHPGGMNSGQATVADQVILATPADDTHNRITDLAQNLCSGTNFQAASSQNDMVLYQECRVADLSKMPLLAAETVNADLRFKTSNSHARTDVRWHDLAPPEVSTACPK